MNLSRKKKFIVKTFTYVASIADFAIEMIVLTYEIIQCFKQKQNIGFNILALKVRLEWFGQQSNDQNYIDSKHLRTPIVFKKYPIKKMG